MPSPAIASRTRCVLSERRLDPGRNIQLTTLLNASLRRVLGEVTFITVVRDQREALMARIRDQLDHEADGYGIQVVDVRIRRADLPEQNSQAVYQRMQTSGSAKRRVPRARRPEGAGIRSNADREATVIIAEAIRPPSRSVAPATRAYGFGAPAVAGGVAPRGGLPTSC